MISFNVLFFWITIMFVFWLGTLGAKKAPVEAKAGVPGERPRRPLATNQSTRNESMREGAWLLRSQGLPLLQEV